MAGPQMKAEDVEKMAKALGIRLTPGNSETIASLLSATRQSVYRKATALPQDAPLAVYFDAR
jgi:hypothetical protein